MWQRLVVLLYTRTPRRLRRAIVRLVTPNYSVGVFVVMRRPDGRILLVDPPYRTGWSLPGGLLRRGETTQQAARREITEELGLEVDLPPPTLAHQRGDVRTITFVVVVDVDDATAQHAEVTTPELDRVQWFLPAELPDLEPDAKACVALVGLEPGPAS